MPFKVTHTSNHPEFIDFGTWVNLKKTLAEQQGDTAEVQKIQAALDAKVAANVGRSAGEFGVNVEEGVTKEVHVTEELGVTVPEFDFYWTQWQQEYGVVVTVEDV